MTAMEQNRPMTWDMWNCVNKRRWDKRAEERKTEEKNVSETIVVAPRPMDWDMWLPTKRR